MLRRDALRRSLDQRSCLGDCVKAVGPSEEEAGIKIAAPALHGRQRAPISKEITESANGSLVEGPKGSAGLRSQRQGKTAHGDLTRLREWKPGIVLRRQFTLDPGQMYNLSLTAALSGVLAINDTETDC